MFPGSIPVPFFIVSKLSAGERVFDDQNTTPAYAAGTIIIYKSPFPSEEEYTSDANMSKRPVSTTSVKAP